MTSFSQVFKEATGAKDPEDNFLTTFSFGQKDNADRTTNFFNIFDRPNTEGAGAEDGASSFNFNFESASFNKNPFGF